jgi:DNA-binding MarR family transcriptional regulator
MIVIFPEFIKGKLMANFKQIYQKFLNLANAVEELSEFPALDPVEQKMLALLSKYWSGKQKITVVEEMHMTNEISTSTIFRYLKKLRQKGYIELVVDDFDNRVKYVSATSQTDSYFNKMGKLMMKATS